MSVAVEYFGFDEPETDWVGLQKVFDFVLDFPLSLGSFILWLAGLFVLFKVAKTISDLRT